ncbi:uncharacterized protein LOC141910485, partial [Tubulanus polymorphus]|uniref:uncharacterized protein LOC141910485 n=1 Tax=Tubulanus polymorphus TaxID=672921 RepID=UPI003DA69AB4
MALKPILRLKADELFMKWLGDTDALETLKENLRQIRDNETISFPAPVASPRNCVVGGKSGNSPRLRPGSPNTPPCSPTSGDRQKIASPRSPRKFQKQTNKQQLGQSKLTKDSTNLVNNNNNKDATSTTI